MVEYVTAQTKGPQILRMKTSVAGHKASFVEKILPLFTGARAIPDQKRPGVSGEGANLLISAATMRCPQFKNFRLPEGMTETLYCNELGCQPTRLTIAELD